VNRYTKSAAVTNIRDYYNPQPHEVATGKQMAAFERAKHEYVSALEAQIQTAKQISFVDVFPKHVASAN
jgi:hypothetical protein